MPIRIKDLPEKSSLSNTDYLVIDSLANIESGKILAKSVIPENSGDISEGERKTYSELLQLISSNSLITGKKYILTDYSTKYIQPYSNILKELTPEILVLTANTSSSFNSIVSSLSYPQDIIYYDFNNMLCEDNITPRNGFIKRRIDTIRNIDAPGDWRFMKWARFNANENSFPTFVAGSQLVRKTLYRALGNIWIALKNITTSFIDQNGVAFRILPYSNSLNIIPKSNDIVQIGINQTEYYTFSATSTEIYNDHDNPNIKNIKIGDSDTLHNNIFYVGNQIGIQNITLGKNCIDNTFYNIPQLQITNSSNISFGEGCENNFITFPTMNIIFGNKCSNNILQYNNSEIIFKNNCSYNFTNTNVYNVEMGDNGYYNMIDSSYDTCFEENCSGNSICVRSSNNKFECFCSDITIGNENINNIIGSGCKDGAFPQQMYNVEVSPNTSIFDFSEVAVLINKPYNTRIYTRDGQIGRVASFFSTAFISTYIG